MPPRKSGSSSARRKQASPGKTIVYQPLRPAKRKGRQATMSFKIPREVQLKLIELGRTNGISQEEILTEALYEWLLSNGEAGVAALLAGEDE
jgi:hypothetical protein